MSSVDPVAAGGFSSAVSHYARARPAYARPAIGRMSEAIPEGTVLDVGSGTGILAGQLARAGRTMVAAEPLAPMLGQLRRSLPSVPAAMATAEMLPFAPRSFAGITVAQAFHWFDAPAALAEFARVLRPGGMLALVWNVRDESVAWVRELTDLMEQRSGGRPYSDAREVPWEHVVGSTGAFGVPEVSSFANAVRSSPALLAERVRSTSYVAAMGEQDREHLLREVDALVEGTPSLRGREQFDYPHLTRLYLWPLG